MKENEDLDAMMDLKLTPEDLAWDHAMNISGSVYTRMKELGMAKSELAAKMGVKPAQITRLIKGQTNMTLKTLARIESALDIDLSSGFVYQPSSAASASSESIVDKSEWRQRSSSARVSYTEPNAPSLSVLKGGLKAA